MTLSLLPTALVGRVANEILDALDYGEDIGLGSALDQWLRGLDQEYRWGATEHELLLEEPLVVSDAYMNFLLLLSLDMDYTSNLILPWNQPDEFWRAVYDLVVTAWVLGRDHLYADS